MPASAARATVARTKAVAKLVRSLNVRGVFMDRTGFGLERETAMAPSIWVRTSKGQLLPRCNISATRQRVASFRCCDVRSLGRKILREQIRLEHLLTCGDAFGIQYAHPQ